ncbi:MAG TPA: Wzz/FepE/Etk N-terminal domain-containing protein, partial [Candidatus Hydrogenedentes bacterium]|nr:Wzz/FepE/Etk N-terminal domain-containing protein [Candidatus Hydrogenedentota bacterium]
MTNETYRSALRTLWRRAPWILGVTALAALAAVGKELLFPPQYAAEQMLMVSGLAAGGEAVALVPQPLSPKAYEYMLKSAAVLGRTIERLEKD